LPEAFDGFTITQISDIHSGSFTNKEENTIWGRFNQSIKNQIYILFTGDIVNNKADEMNDWIRCF